MVVRDATVRALQRGIDWPPAGRGSVGMPLARLRRRDRATNSQKSGPPAACRGAERYPAAKEA